MLSKLFKRREIAAESPHVPDGRRIYAIGDVHGRLDLLGELLAKIDVDDQSRAPARTQHVFLGDLIDRGPDSAGVVERTCRLAQDRPSASFLMGNHEELFLGAVAGDAAALRAFCRVGGRETIISYGVHPADYDRMSYTDVAAALDEVVPATHLAFLSGFADMEEIGDYLFVHAGINPNLTLEDQRPRDLRWIREPFLQYRDPLPRMVVHGHTIRPDVEIRSNRIGIDTGAYETGRLTALGLEGGERWVLQT